MRKPNWLAIGFMALWPFCLMIAGLIAIFLKDIGLGIYTTVSVSILIGILVLDDRQKRKKKKLRSN